MTTTAVARIHSVCLFYWLCVTVTETALLARPRYSCSTYYRLANTFVALMGVVAARHRTIIHRARLKRINRASPGYAKLCNVSCPCAVRHTDRFSSARVIMSLYMFIHSNRSEHCKNNNNWKPKASSRDGQCTPAGYSVSLPRRALITILLVTIRSISRKLRVRLFMVCKISTAILLILWHQLPTELLKCLVHFKIHLVL